MSKCSHHRCTGATCMSHPIGVSMSEELWTRAKTAMKALGVNEDEGNLITLATFIRTLKAERDALRERLSLYEGRPAKSEFVVA